MIMKPRERFYDPFANVQPRIQRPAANDAVTPSTPVTPIRSDPRSVLEARYPGMAHSISLMWGYPELNAYFDKLWLADGTQTPLTPDAMSELMLLAQVHQQLVPQRPGRSLSTIYGSDYAPRRKDVWDDVPRRR